MGSALAAGPVHGLVVFTLETSCLIALAGCALYHREIGRILKRLARRVAPAAESPKGLPIEQLAGNARRLRAKLATLPPGTPMARRLGVSRAYDDLLADACRKLDVPDTLSDIAPGPDRELERLRVEHELEEAGLRLTPESG